MTDIKTAYSTLAQLFADDANAYHKAIRMLQFTTKMTAENGDTLIDDEDAIELAEKLTDKVTNMLIHTTDTRFTTYDIIDAVIHWNGEFSLRKVLELSEEKFKTLMFYMAQYKRNIYEADCEPVNLSEITEILQSIL